MKKPSHFQDNEITRLALLENTVETINATMSRLENKMDTKFSSLENKMDSMENKLESKIDSNFQTLDRKIDDISRSINNRMWFNFYWTITGFASVLALIAHVLKWI